MPDRNAAVLKIESFRRAEKFLDGFDSGARCGRDVALADKFYVHEKSGLDRRACLPEAVGERHDVEDQIGKFRAFFRRAVKYLRADACRHFRNSEQFRLKEFFNDRNVIHL